MWCDDWAMEVGGWRGVRRLSDVNRRWLDEGREYTNYTLEVALYDLFISSAK